MGVVLNPFTGELQLVSPPPFILAKTAARALSGHRVVKDVGADVVDYADAFAQRDFETLAGLSLGAASLGAAVSVQFGGEIVEPSWSWTPGGPIFCAGAGALTQTFDPTWAWCCVVGYAISSTKMRFMPQEPVTL